MRRRTTRTRMMLVGAMLLAAATVSAEVWEVGNQLVRYDVDESDVFFGFALAVGDFNGDGIDDLAVGAPGLESGSGVDLGSVRVYLGSTSGAVTYLAGWFPGYFTSPVYMGKALAAGDFDGDGRDELAIGKPGMDIGSSPLAGEVSVGDYDGSTWSWSRFDQDDIGLTPAEPLDGFGSTLAVGRFNGDIYDDLAIGTPDENWSGDEDAGCVEVLYGGPGGLTAAGAQGLVAGHGGMLGTRTTEDRMGTALAVGDFDGDGYFDLAIGAPFRDISGAADAGQVHIVRGSSTGLTASGQQLISDGTFPGSVYAAGELFGHALAASRFDETPADCYAFGCTDDLAVGAPGQVAGGFNNAGRVVVAYGGVGGLQTSYATFLSAFDLGSTPEAGAGLGLSLAAGRGDAEAAALWSYADLAVGAIFEDTLPSGNDGVTYLLFGASGGVDADRQEQRLEQLPGFAVGPPQPDDNWGQTLVFGDFNGDGHGDLAVGVPAKDDGGYVDRGVVQILYGGLFNDGFEVGGPSAWSGVQP